MLGIALSLLIGVLIWHGGWLLAGVASMLLRRSLRILVGVRFALQPAPVMPSRPLVGGLVGRFLWSMIQPVYHTFRVGGSLAVPLAAAGILTLLFGVGELIDYAFPLLDYSGPMGKLPELLWWPLVG